MPGKVVITFVLACLLTKPMGGRSIFTGVMLTGAVFPTTNKNRLNNGLNPTGHAA
jgi:hypothetical protein